MVENSQEVPEKKKTIDKLIRLIWSRLQFHKVYVNQLSFASSHCLPSNANQHCLRPFLRRKSIKNLYSCDLISSLFFLFQFIQLSSTAKVARWFQQLNSNPASLSRPESGFVSGDSRSERNPDDPAQQNRETDEICDEYLLVEGTSNLWRKLSAKKRKKLLGLRLGKVTTF